MQNHFKTWILYPYQRLWRFTDWLVDDLLKLGKVKKGDQPNLPATIEAYTEQFRGNLHGAWDTAAFPQGGTVCMTDTYVSFGADGEGLYQFGLLEHAAFMWRQIGDFKIEMQKEEEPTWTIVEYEFSKIYGVVVLELNSSKGSPGWIGRLCLEGLPLS